MLVFHTERLILRPFKLDDIEDFYEYSKDKNVGPMAGWNTHKSKKESMKVLKSIVEVHDMWAIEFNNKVIGSINLQYRGEDDREMGFGISSLYWNQGFATEAAMKIIDYCFNELNINTLWCGHFEDNLRSKRVIEKCGFTYYNTINQKVENFDNKKHTILMYKKIK